MREVKFIYKIMDSKFEKNLARLETIVMVITTVVMLTILAIVVGMRYVLHRDFYGYNEIVLADSFWMYFIGAAFAMRREEHIKADILKNFISKKSCAVMRLLADILQTTVNYAMVVLSYNLVASNYRAWTITPLWELPFFVPQISIFISFVLMAFYLTIYMIRDYNDLVVLFRGRD
ncbi:MAG: TRAP transporter small permease subunit [Synergistes sp.]|nr:TRAP transporter small permease subunit [Synergistes sp.]